MSAKKQMEAFECASGDEVRAWHDQAYAEYEEALAAFSEATSSDQPSALIDPKIKKRYEEARDRLRTGVHYWREVGEQVGTRVGILVEDNVIAVDPDEEG